MRIKELELQNFRNIEKLSLSGFEDMNIICGENAQGKTNLLEGIWLFTGAKSFRNSKDKDFLKFGCEKARLKLLFTAAGIENDAEITVSEHREAILNGGNLKSPSALAGRFTATVFSPADLLLVTGGPAVRRKFLDLAIGQLYPSYINILRGYMRSVAQRNRIIKDFKYDSSLSIMLEVFEKEIAESGKKIIVFRKKYISLLGEFLPEVYAGLSGGREKLETEYLPLCGGNELSARLEESRRTDMLTGSTSVGPHRDELEFKINGISARIYGSQGQKRSVALSVKLAEAEVINKISGEYPVFLLDDVMSELDPVRQNYILNHIKGLQSFLTCCDPSNISNLKKGKIFNVKEGRVTG